MLKVRVLTLMQLCVHIDCNTRIWIIWRIGLQLTVFTDESDNYFLNCLVHKTPEKSKTCSLLFPLAQGDDIKCLVLCNQQSKTRGKSIYCNVIQGNAENSHI